MRTIDWFITKKCNSKLCPFCYAPYNKFGEDASLKQALAICERLKQQRIDTVTICGGEPLLYHKIEDVITYLDELNINVVLNTGLDVSDGVRRIKSIERYLYMLSLPIDSCRDETVKLLRGNSVMSRVYKLLDTYMEQKERPKIKIGTVVNALNMNEIDEIGHIIDKYSNSVDAWRLYMFSPYGIGKTNKDRLLINDDEYHNAIKGVLQYKNKFKISTRTREENLGYCMIMDSQGNFYRYDEEYISLDVNIFDSFDNICVRYDLDLHNKQKEWHNIE